MMKVIHDARLPESLASEIDEMLRFYMNVLLPFHIVENLSINVEFDRSISECACVIMEEDDLGLPILNSFDLTIKKADKNLASHIAHECVHIKQYVLGELRYDAIVRKRNGVAVVDEWVKVWNEEDWLPEHEDEHESFDSPWEIEAYGREVGLVRRWKKYKGNKK